MNNNENVYEYEYVKEKLSLKDRIDRFVPKYVSANLILFFMSAMTLIRRVSKNMAAQHRRENEAAWKEKGSLVLDEDGFYIEDQSKMDFLQYGRHGNWLSRRLLKGRTLTGKENTCEVIALYNCLCCINRNSTENEQKSHDLDMKDSRGKSIIDGEVTFPALLEYFERKGLAFGGYFGTSPLAIKRFLKKCGYEVLVLKGKNIYPRTMNQLQREKVKVGPSAYIVTTFNDGNHLSEMIHTMCITKEGRGFVLHNDYEGTRRRPTLSIGTEYYNEGKGKPIIVMKIIKEVANE